MSSWLSFALQQKKIKANEVRTTQLQYTEMKKYIPYLLKFAFMIFAVFPAIKHEWLAISMGVIALAIPLVCFVWCWISDSVMKAFEHAREDSIYNVMISLIGFIIYYSVYDSLLLWTIILAFHLLDFYYEYSSQKDHKQ